MLQSELLCYNVGDALVTYKWKGGILTSEMCHKTVKHPNIKLCLDEILKVSELRTKKLILQTMQYNLLIS